MARKRVIKIQQQNNEIEALKQRNEIEVLKQKKKIESLKQRNEIESLKRKNEIEVLKQKIDLLRNYIPKIKTELSINTIFGNTILICGMDEFLELLNNFSPDVLYNTSSGSLLAHINSNPFSSPGRMALFIKNGIITSMRIDKSKTLTQFLNLKLEEFQNKFNSIEAGFKQVSHYEEALLISDENEAFDHIISTDDYYSFIASPFYQVRNVDYRRNYNLLNKYPNIPQITSVAGLYVLYNEFIIGKFEDMNIYFDAKNKGFVNHHEYSDFLKLGYKTKEDYLSGKAGQFIEAKSFYAAKEAGFDNLTEFKMFQQSGCKTREDYLYRIESLPKKIKKYKNIIESYKKDAENSLKKKNYEEFFSKRYTSIEKLVELKHLLVFNQDILNNTVIEETVAKLEGHYSVKIVDKDELKYWRRLRNEIIHENRKIDAKTCERSRMFFKEFEGKLEQIK